MSELNHRTQLMPGPGLVIRWSNSVIVLGGEDAAVEAAYDSLLGADGSPPPTGLLIERLGRLHDIDGAAATATPGGLRLLRFGNGSAEVVGAPPVASAARDIEDMSATIWLGLGDVPGPDGQRVVHDLLSGVVPGSGVFLAPVTATGSLTSVNSQPSFELVDLAVAAPARDPLPTSTVPEPESEAAAAAPTASEAATEAAASGQAPSDAPAPPPPPQADQPAAELPAPPAEELSGPNVVMGIECSRRHFNHPQAAACQMCGISMVHLTPNLIRGVRPTLGFIVFDHGTTYALDRSYLLGREPTMLNGADPLKLSDPDHTVSREHARLSFEGWDVMMTDLGSTNGTFLWNTVVGQWNRLAPNTPTLVAPGTQVAVGNRMFIYEAVARSV